MTFEVIKILILKTIAMKNTFFSKTLVIIFLFGGLSANAQVRVKTNTHNNNKKVVVKTNTHNNNKKVVVKTNRSNNYIGGVRVKTNKHRVVTNKPNRPHVIVNRPSYNRHGYIWREGYWKWNAFYGQYTWQKARWIKVQRNHYWVPGSWEIIPGGFFWIEGYWELEF